MVVPENQGTSTHGFAISVSSIGFSYIIALAGISRTVLSNSGKRRLLDCSWLEGQEFRLSPSSVKLAEAFVYISSWSRSLARSFPSELLA